MPTYEYVCTECGSPLEVVQSIHEPSLTECPSCGGRLRKVFGNVGVVFKGSGFYRTDNRSKGAKSAAGSSSAASGKEPASSTSPGDSGSGPTAKSTSSSASKESSSSSSAPTKSGTPAS